LIRCVIIHFVTSIYLHVSFLLYFLHSINTSCSINFRSRMLSFLQFFGNSLCFWPL